MKLKYLGTAAAEGWPGMFCQCESCKKAKEAGGRNIRTRSQAIVDDKLLIDFPADTYMHVLYNGLELSKVENCIITHNHGDHLYPKDFGMRRSGFAYLKPETVLTVHGTKAVIDRVNQNVNAYNLEKQGRVKFKRITPFSSFDIDEYTVTPLKADHAKDTDPVIYIISNGEKSILYANDTGYFPDETWDYLKENKPYFDMVSLDCTCGINECKNNHMGLKTNEEVKNRLIEISCAGDKTVFCINHFSHNGKAIYDEMLPIAKKYGFKVSYDGMVVKV